VFGFGFILCELISLKVANTRVFKRIAPEFNIQHLEIKERATSDCPSELVMLAINCTTQDPNDRPTMRDVLFTLHDIEKNLQLRDTTSRTQFNHKSSKSLFDVSIPNPSLSIQSGLLDHRHENPVTPNLIHGSNLSFNSSESSPYSVSTHRQSIDSCLDRISISLDLCSLKSEFGSMSHTTSKLSSICKNPFPNFLVGGASITLSRHAVPQINTNHGVANFTFQSTELKSKLKHEGLGSGFNTDIESDKKK